MSARRRRRKRLPGVVVLLVCLAVVGGDAVRSDPAAGPEAAPGLPDRCEDPTRELRGVWLATVRNIDWPSETGLDADRQREELTEQLDTAVDLGLNTIFLQVRPTADALYDSPHEPWARYLTGEQGGDPGYDPLRFAVEEAHARGLDLHAWFNPYRVGWQEADLDHLTSDHPAEQNPDWLVTYADEGYLDPGLPEVRAWVVQVVTDVVERYDIDGVHLDDYFYPYPGPPDEEFDDDASWEAHGGDFDDRDDWRRDNVNTLIAELGAEIRAAKPWVRFGVSPFGVWRNASTDPDGSDTTALQSYDAIYADTRTWIEREWIDYVVPQLYWPRGFEAADYATLVPWWAEEVAGTSVDLYIGQGAYRVGSEDWPEGELAAQLDLNAEHGGVSGEVFFSMGSLTGPAEEEMAEIAEGRYRDPALPPPVPRATEEPAPVADLAARRTGDGVELSWRVPQGARRFAIYRVPPDAGECAVTEAESLVAVRGAAAEPGREQTFTDADADPGAAARYHVTAVDAYGTESGPGWGADIEEAPR